MLVVISIGIVSSSVGLKIYVITNWITNYKSIIKKRKEHEKLLLAKDKLNTIEVVFSKNLIILVITNLV